MKGILCFVGTSTDALIVKGEVPELCTNSFRFYSKQFSEIKKSIWFRPSDYMGQP